VGIDDDARPGLETTDFYDTFALLPTFEVQRARARIVMLRLHPDKLRGMKAPSNIDIAAVHAIYQDLTKKKSGDEQHELAENVNGRA
jgi:uncharacterized protein YjaG (DUF416 family)